MSKLTKALTAAAGNAGGDKLYVEDVFSTYVYPGNNSTLTITNGIDLAGEGGMVWSKSRNTNDNHRVYDTERGTTNGLIPNAANDQVAWGDFVSYNSGGYSLASGGLTSPLASNFVSWTFRKAKKFFDVVTYTGNGASSRTIAHSLESVPGMMIVKGASNVSGWRTYHTSLGATKYVQLQTTAAEATYNVWNDTTPTDSVFSISSDINSNGVTYVAYLFASDAGGFGADGSENIIKCGSYSGTASVTVGFEPQWLLIKKTSAVEDWQLYDIMRGIPTGSNDAALIPNSSGAETSTFDGVTLTATGFKITNMSGDFIYMAIRRPMKVPESGTEVYNNLANRVGTSAAATISGVGFAVDLMIPFAETTGSSKPFVDRLRGATKYLLPPYRNAEQTNTNVVTSFASMDGVIVGADSLDVINNYYNSSRRYAASFFKRASGFMDVVCYTGNGVAGARLINHNLTTAPEFFIVKNRDAGGNNNNWGVYQTYLKANSRIVYLNLDYTDANDWTSFVNPTATTIDVGGVGFGGSSNTNVSGQDCVAYLFATLAGISKVGNYTGTAATLNIDCGFAAAARFILIKRTDAAGDWYMWDSARGIVAGNSPYLIINTTGASVTNTDYIDPLSAGFTVTSSAPAALNASGGKYIFLAIA